MPVRTYQKISAFPVMVFAMLPLVFLLFSIQPAYSGNDKNNEKNVVDTLEIKKSLTPIELKLQDPLFDIRTPEGTNLRPWHDINSMYPRRTVPRFQLAIHNRNFLLPHYYC